MGVRVRVRFLFFFIINSPSLTRDVTCSRLYFDGKKYEEAVSDEHPLTGGDIKFVILNSFLTLCNPQQELQSNIEK